MYQLMTLGNEFSFNTSNWIGSQLRFIFNDGFKYPSMFGDIIYWWFYSPENWDYKIMCPIYGVSWTSPAWIGTDIVMVDIRFGLILSIELTRD